MNALKHHSELTAINIVNAIAAAFLFISPWLFGFAGEPAASWNAWISGLLIAGLALAAVVELREWEEWINLLLGLWVAVAPWLVGFAGVASAMWTHVGVGVVVAILAAVELWLIRQSPHATA
jgi:uncharacterized membrane protein (DUF441 family)